MIGYLSGTVQSASGRTIILDVNGVGYRVTIPEKNVSSLSEIGLKVNIFTHFVLNPRDGSVELYGFKTPEELHFFGLLTSVSGIGPKSAQAILSSVDLQQLQIGIIKEDPSYLTKVSGVGQKTAQRLILELKNKVMADGLTEGKEKTELTADGEAMDALIALGYSQFQARDAIKAVATNITTTEDKIKEALRILGMGQRRPQSEVSPRKNND